MTGRLDNMKNMKKIEGYVIANKYGLFKIRSLYGNGFFVYKSEEDALWDINNSKQKIVKILFCIYPRRK